MACKLIKHCRYASTNVMLVRSLHSAYIIKPNTTAHEQEKQACHLTNTLLVGATPPSFVDLSNRSITPENRQELTDAIKRCIIEVNYFHRDREVHITKRTTARKKAWRISEFKWTIAEHILQNLLRITWTCQHIKNCGVADTTMSYRPDITAPWSFGGENLQVSGKHGHLVSGRKLLPLFADFDQIEATRGEHVVWDDIISPFFDLHQLPSNFESYRGFHDNAPFPCPQKLMSINNFRWRTRMNTGQGIFYSFAHALTYALQNGGEMGKDLKEPVPMQYVAFNGTSFFFVWYQLNTLNFNHDDENSIKNMAWIAEHKLYDQVSNKLSDPEDFIEYTGTRTSLVDFDRKRLAETFSDERTVKVAIEGFDREAAGMFLDFMLYPVQT